MWDIAGGGNDEKSLALCRHGHIAFDVDPLAAMAELLQV